MKIKSITASNFLGARAVRVELTKPVALFAGPNYSGKSSLQEAVRMAMVGESVRVALKKDYGALISDGHESGFAEVVTDFGDYSVVLPSGKGHHCDIISSLPYVLDAQRFARLAENDRRNFLFGLMGVKPEGAVVKDRLTARGCVSAKVDQIAPILRAGFDAAAKEAASRARDAKSSWKTTTGGEAYGSVKAASYRAMKPEVDADRLEQERAILVKIEEEIESSTRILGDLQGQSRQATERRSKIYDLREKAAKFARITEKLARDANDLEEWEKKVAALEGSAKSQEALACPGCGMMLVMNGGELVHAAPMAKGTEDDLAKLPEYKRALQLMRSAFANDRRDLTIAESAARALRELEGESFADAGADEEIATITSRIGMLKHDKKNQQAGLRMLEDSARQAAEADVKTSRAAALHQEVQQWEAIASALAPDGIPAELLAEALGPINHRLESSSQAAEWMHVHIDPDMGIFAAYEAQPVRAYALLSESEKWRADAMIAEAVSHISGVKLLSLDRYDVLDGRGREDALIWLDDLAAAGEVDTAMLFGTLKGLPKQLPESVEGIWLGATQ